MREGDETLGERLRAAERFSADIDSQVAAGEEVLSRLVQIAAARLPEPAARAAPAVPPAPPAPPLRATPRRPRSPRRPSPPGRGQAAPEPPHDPAVRDFRLVPIVLVAAASLFALKTMAS